MAPDQATPQQLRLPPGVRLQSPQGLLAHAHQVHLWFVLPCRMWCKHSPNASLEVRQHKVL